MRLTIERSALLKSLAHIHSVVERRTTIPILSNVLLRADDAGLGLTATDMDLAVQEQAPADVTQAGSTTVAAHTLYDIVRKLPEGGQIEIRSGAEQGLLQLRCGRSNLKLATLPSEDFPVMAEGDLPFGFDLPAATLAALIDRTRFAISTEETRYYLNGIYLHAAKHNSAGVLRGVATDGHRLARVELPLPAGADGMPGVIVPRKAVQEVRRLLDDAQGDVRVALSDTKIRFGVGDTVLTSKLIDGTFPDYERVIPFANDKIMRVNVKAFSQAVDLVSTISTDKTRAVKLKLDKDTLVLSATSPESGSAVEEIEVSYRDAPIDIGFNARYLLDIAQQIVGDDAQFVLADAGAPTLVRDDDDPSAVYVLMPMRVG